MVCALFFIDLDRVGSLPGLVQSLTTDSCFVDLPDVTLVYSKIVEVFVDAELKSVLALLIAE